MTDEALFAAFREAEYHVELPPHLVLRIDALHPQLDAGLERRAIRRWAYVTAYNPGGDRADGGVNLAADAEFRTELRARGLEHAHAWSQARDGSRREEGAFIFDLKERAAVELGARFGQKAVVVGRVGERARLCRCGP